MPQKTRYNHEEALQMISKGTPLAKIAKHFNVSYQSIYDLRKSQKVDKITKKTIKYLAEPDKIGLDILRNLDTNQIDNITIRIIQWAYKYPELVERTKTLENQLASARDANKILQEKVEVLENRRRVIEAAKSGVLVTSGD